jgi:endonuclease G, mitochondrial
MKKLLTTLILLFSIINLRAQDTVRLVHRGYTSVYSKSLHYPVLVEWWCSKDRVGCANPLPRKDQFAPDPLLKNETDLEKDYLGSKEKDLKKVGFDRGHMCPAADNQCGDSKFLAECFYFSNMAAQYHSLNAGDWKSLETRTRDLSGGNSKNHIESVDSIHIWCGSVGSLQKIGTTTCPAKCWKVIYIKKTKTYEAYIFDNTPEKPKGLQHWKVNVSDVEKLTGFKFNS